MVLLLLLLAPIIDLLMEDLSIDGLLINTVPLAALSKAPVPAWEVLLSTSFSSVAVLVSAISPQREVQ